MTWAEYAEGLDERLLDLHRRVQSGAYRAPPVRRVEIAKPDGGTRPLGVAALEDKIVQKAVTEIILTPIYEPVFLGFSYGFRPGRGAHDALDALAVAIKRRKVNWVVDCDIQGFFDTVSRDWLVRFLKHRIGDRRVIRLIVKWLNYYAVPTSARFLRSFTYILKRIWLKALRRPSQRDRFSWQRLQALVDRYWPKPWIRHPWPEQRFDVKCPR